MKLLDQVREVARLRHLALSTERSYVHWIERYIRFHGIRHPKTMAGPEVEAFLNVQGVSVAGESQPQVRQVSEKPYYTRV